MSETYRLEIDTGEGQRGRSFGGVVLAVAVASGLHPLSQLKDPMRPVFVALAVSTQETRPLLENLRAGRKAHLFGDGLVSKGEKFELCKSAGFLFATQQTEAGSVISAHVPELFNYTPGLIEGDVRAVVMPWREDVARVLQGREAEVGDAMAHVHKVLGKTITAEDVGLAAVVCRYLAQRSELPISPDLSFTAQLFQAATAGGRAIMSEPLSLNTSADGAIKDYEERAARVRIGFRAHVDRRAPLLRGAAIRASHAQLEELLSEQSRIFERTRRGASKRTTRAPALRVPAAEVI